MTFPTPYYQQTAESQRCSHLFSRDVLRRWAFPLVPDSGVVDNTIYEIRRGAVYIARENVILARTASVIGPSLIGPNTSLSSNTLVRHSTIGKNNILKSRSKVLDSYVFDNVKIGKGCVLNGCIVGEGVVIGDGVTIGKGALIGDGVRIAKGTVIKPFERVGRQPFREGGFDESDDEEDEEMLAECK